MELIGDDQGVETPCLNDVAMSAAQVVLEEQERRQRVTEAS